MGINLEKVANPRLKPTKKVTDSSIMTYSEALKELENIMNALREGEVGIDELEAKTQRATELIQWCSTRLRTVEGQLDKISNSNESELF